MGEYAGAFVLISGPQEAKLPVSPESPYINFYWNGSAPEGLKNPEEVDESWVGLEPVTLMQNIIVYAVRAWMRVPGSYLRFQLSWDPSAVEDGEDRKFSIVVKESSNLTSAAYARPVIQDGVITDCDINVSGSSVSVKSLVYTMIHEMGHCIGLGHAHTNYGAIMGYSRDDRKPRLGADDIAGLLYLYPSPDPDYDEGDKDPLNCGSNAIWTQGGGGGSSSTRTFIFLSPLLLVLWMELRSRRRVVSSSQAV